MSDRRHLGLDVKTTLFLGALVTVFLTSAASAADLPLKAPLHTAPTASPWSVELTPLDRTLGWFD